jgi:hypothetical protein
MLPLILVAVGAYLIGDSVLEDKKYAKGGKTQGYDDKEDERLAMEHGKMSKKDLDSTHARRDDARFEERGKMDKGGYVDVTDPRFDDREDNKEGNLALYELEHEYPVWENRNEVGIKHSFANVWAKNKYDAFYKLLETGYPSGASVFQRDVKKRLTDFNGNKYDPNYKIPEDYFEPYSKEILKLQVNEDRTKLQASSRLPERSRLTIGGGLAWSF